ncbi:hypothetical protein J0J21_06260 [Vibrio vulnificus]|uniref:hypothetical protein n=1 Tax=Vibrio vulnificus TaxID=672 RepID=UPI0019D41F4F|nr:hypothetical protein [Vibrio vulnificus]MBN8135367.1 hypothetical protein [Vibrio vulnificus]HDY7659515.1 hypothetical protein [Vibrio vulnificus]
MYSFVKELFVFYSYYLLVAYSFNNFIIPNFDYFGFRNNDVSLVKLITSSFICFLLFYLLPDKLNRASRVLVCFLNVCVLIPSTYILWNVNQAWLSENDAFVFLMTMYVCFLIINASLWVERKKITLSKRLDEKYLLTIAVVLLGYFVLKTSSTFSFVSILELQKLNEIRAETSIGGIWAYLYLWLISILLPYLIAVMYMNGYSKKAFFVSLVYVYFAFSMGAKILLVAPLVFLFLKTISKQMSTSKSQIVIGFSFAVIMVYVVGFFNASIGYAFKSLFIFRTLSIPNLAFPIYFDYFSKFDFTYFTHVGPLKSFATDIMEIPLAVRLHNEYGLGNFNANFLANDGYASLGLIGMVIMSIIYSSYLYLLDCFVVGEHKNRIMIISLAYIIMFQSNVSFFTLLLSHGLLLLPLITLFFERKKNVLQ